MNNEVRSAWLLVATVVIVASAGCRHKPAYSDIDTNKSASSQNQNSPTREVSPPAPEAAREPAPPQPPTTSSQTPASSLPSFFDQARGQVKDLPSYPHAARLHVQIGPIGELNLASIILQTSDRMDRIAAFYDRAIKDNQWKVNDRIIDPELSEWNLEKGKDNTGKVQVKRDTQTGRLNIIIVRGEKIVQPAK
jgi:hypothetical protein